MEQATEQIKIALVGKYVSNRDAYFSVTEALSHAGTYCNYKYVIGFKNLLIRPKLRKI
jgi:CTP synthase